jgi:hypothetical protein
MVLMGFENGQGANLGKVFPYDVQTAAPCDPPGLIFEDNYVPQGRIKLAQGASQKTSCLREIPQHFLNFDYIGYPGLTNHMLDPQIHSKWREARSMEHSTTETQRAQRKESGHAGKTGSKQGSAF